jgi:hypothetical protein
LPDENAPHHSPRSNDPTRRSGNLLDVNG